MDEDGFVYEDEQVLRHNLNWGDYLRPHHFRFEEASCVRARIAGRPDLLCSAVSILGAGMFKESESSKPIEFHDGAVIVKAGERVKLFLFEDFRKLFFLENGTPIESIYQIDFQTPKK